MRIVYIDDRGWLYRVERGLAGVYKGAYLKPDAPSWRHVSKLSWTNDQEQAKEELDAYAQKKGWQRYDMVEDEP